MNWNAFLGAFTWCETVLALIASVFLVGYAVAAWEEGKPQKMWVILCAALSIVALVANVSIIVGMGWYPK